MKFLFIVISLIFSIYSLNGNNDFDEFDDIDFNQISNAEGDLFDKLSQNKSWLAISYIWKTLNKLEDKKNVQNKYEYFETLTNEIDKVNQYLKNLVNCQLITNQEKETLSKIYKDRLNYLKFEAALVRCYRMSDIGLKVAETRGDLEKRYDMLEKLYTEGKINTETFNMTCNKIADNLKFIDDNSLKNPETEINDGIVDLIIYLNK